MPLRAALNVVYALLTKDMDGKQRADFETSIHGWDEDNSRANRALRQGDDGGES